MACNLLQQAFAVDSREGNTGEQRQLFARTPLGTYCVVLVVGHLVHRLLAIGAVHHDFPFLHDTDHLIARHRLAAGCRLGGVVLVLLIKQEGA